MEEGICQLIYVSDTMGLSPKFKIPFDRPIPALYLSPFLSIHFESFTSVHFQICTPLDTMYVDDGSWASRLALKDKAQVTVGDFVSIIKVCLFDRFAQILIATKEVRIV